MPKAQQRCTYCSEPATLLCDYHLGKPTFSRGQDGQLRPWYTCDLPMCRNHAEHRGNLHVRFSQSVNGKHGFFDSIDYCLEHAGQRNVPAPRIVEGEAERLRRVVRERAERRALESGVLPVPLAADDQLALF